MPAKRRVGESPPSAPTRRRVSTRAEPPDCAAAWVSVGSPALAATGLGGESSVRTAQSARAAPGSAASVSGRPGAPTALGRGNETALNVVGHSTQRRAPAHRSSWCCCREGTGAEELGRRQGDGGVQPRAPTTADPRARDASYRGARTSEGRLTSMRSNSAECRMLCSTM